MTYIGEDEPSVVNSAVIVVCIILVIATLIALPIMVQDREEQKRKAWREEGCQMYDNYKAEDVPAKCGAYFIDHYQSQQTRVQLPDEK